MAGGMFFWGGPLLMACLMSRSSIGQVWAEVPILAPAEVTAGGNFGAAIDLNGDWLLVGAPGTDDEGAGSGAAYLYNRYEGGENAWGLVKKLVPPSGYAGAAFGSAVSLMGDRAFISAPGEPWSTLPVGAVHVFERDMGGSGNWGHRQRIVPDTVQAGMEFGASFTATDDLLIVLSPRYDEQMGDQQFQGVGAVISFTADPGGLFSERRFVRGDSIVAPCIFRPCAGRNSAIHDGSVFFAGSNGAFYTTMGTFQDEQPGSIISTPVLLSDDFGIPPSPIYFTGISADDDLLVVCLRSDDNIYPRIVSFLSENGAGPIQEGVMRPDTANYLDWWEAGGWGKALDIDGDLVAVAAFGHPVFTPLGHAEVYQRDEMTADHWSLRARLVPSDPATGDLFGASVSVASGLVAVGAPGSGADDVGKVHLFSDPTAGIIERYAERPLLVRPNPVLSGADAIRLARNDLHYPGEVAIVAQDGRIVRQLHLSSDLLPIHDLSTGAYTITFRSTDQRVPMRSARFIILP